MPDRLNAAEGLLPLCATVSVALRGPSADGAKVTVNVQVALMASAEAVLQSPLRVKSLGCAPLKVNEVNASAAVPLLRSVTDR